MTRPAKKTTRRRVFFVALNTDELSIHMDNLMDIQGKADFLDGMYRGSRNVELDPCGMSKAFQRGYAFGAHAYQEAAAAFTRSREAGKKSAQVRAEREGTAQPTARRTEGRTDLRSPFDDLPKPLRGNVDFYRFSEGENGNFDESEHEDLKEGPETWENRGNFNRVSKPLRESVR